MKTNGSTDAEKIKSLLASVPKAKDFKNDSKIQEKTCLEFAKKINDEHAGTIGIYADAPHKTCQEIMDVISSLNAGTYTEFLGVYGDVRAVIHNLRVVKDVIAKQAEFLAAEISKASPDAGENMDFKDQLASLRSLLDELDRQIGLLNNLFNGTLEPTAKTLAEIMAADVNSGHKSITKIDSQTVYNALHGPAMTAYQLELISEALKKVKMTMDEFKNAGELSLQRKAEEAMHGMSIEDSMPITEALKTLEKYHHLIGSKRMSGGDERFAKTATEKKYETREKVKKLLMSTFTGEIHNHFNKFIVALNAIADRIGKDVPLSDQLDGFRDSVARLRGNMFGYDKLFYAMISYYNDAMSLQKRTESLGNLRMVSQFLDSIIEMPLYASSKHYFVAAKQAITDILNTIDKYSTEVIVKFGKGEDSIEGGADVVTMQIFKTTKTIEDALMKFDYAYKNVQMYQNLATKSKELEQYSKKYAEMTATGIADILKFEQKKYNAMVKRIDESFDVNKDNTDQHIPKDDNVKEKKAAKDFLNSQWKAKQNFYATLEAVDEYMRVFTDTLVTNLQILNCFVYNLKILN